MRRITPPGSPQTAAAFRVVRNAPSMPFCTSCVVPSRGLIDSLGAVVDAGSENVPVGAPIATIVHTEEDIALYQEAQEARGGFRHPCEAFGALGRDLSVVAPMPQPLGLGRA